MAFTVCFHGRKRRFQSIDEATEFCADVFQRTNIVLGVESERKTTLLASAGTIHGIAACINRYWASDKYSVNPETLAIEHPDRVVAGVRVIQLKGRFRFEAVE